MYYPDMGAPSAVIDKYIQRLRSEYNFYIITKSYKTLEEFEYHDNVRYISGVRHNLILRCERNITNGRNIYLNKIILFLINAYKLFATQVSNPTANSWENRSYFNQLQRLNKEVGIDCVISVSNTCFCQFAAQKFKQRHPSIKWLTFITDPFAENYIYYRYKLLPKLWHKINLDRERSFYEEADHNVMCEDMYRFASQVLHIDEGKLSCFRYVLNDKYSNIENKVSSNLNSSIRLIYAGAVYRDIRNPEFMLDVISNIPEVNLDIYVNKGECEDILERYAKGNISRHGYAPKDRYDQMICCEYDILVNIGNISTLQTPSKTVDLLSTGKPILNFYFSKDSQYDMIERYPLGMNIQNGEDCVVDKIRDFCVSMKGRRLSFKQVERLYPENNLQKQTELLRKIIEA